MELILSVVIAVFLLVISGLLVWVIVAQTIRAKEAAGQAAGIGLLQQQLEAIKAAQDKTGESLQKSLQTGQSSLNENLQSSRQVLSQLNSQIGDIYLFCFYYKSWTYEKLSPGHIEKTLFGRDYKRLKAYRIAIHKNKTFLFRQSCIRR